MKDKLVEFLFRMQKYQSLQSRPFFAQKFWAFLGQHFSWAFTFVSDAQTQLFVGEICIFSAESKFIRVSHAGRNCETDFEMRDQLSAKAMGLTIGAALTVTLPKRNAKEFTIATDNAHPSAIPQDALMAGPHDRPISKKRVICLRNLNSACVRKGGTPILFQIKQTGFQGIQL